MIVECLNFFSLVGNGSYIRCPGAPCPITLSRPEFLRMIKAGKRPDSVRSNCKQTARSPCPSLCISTSYLSLSLP